MRSASEPGPLQLVRQGLSVMRGAKLRVAKALLEMPARAGSESITDLARRAGTSAATVNRVSKDLGFAGYPALRAAIAHEIGRDVQAGWEKDIGTDIGPGDDPARVLKILANTQTRAVRSAVSSIDIDAVTKLADAIVGATRIHIFGQWGDSVPALELYLRLFRIGCHVWLHDGPTGASVSAALMGPGDVGIAFSRRGTDPSALAFLEAAEAAGAITGAITGQPDSAVATKARISVYGGVLAGDAWVEHYAGRATDSLASSLLWVLVAQRAPQGLTH